MICCSTLQTFTVFFTRFNLSYRPGLFILLLFILYYYYYFYYYYLLLYYYLLFIYYYLPYYLYSLKQTTKTEKNLKVPRSKNMRMKLFVDAPKVPPSETLWALGKTYKNTCDRSCSLCAVSGIKT